ncbi:glycoside hydrolase family 68 protein [Erythrobacteraceae bacterium WH01K]|nr:glycoside hydrolase family 68 protein [Erythrobacteraceae bacterium WH01K]
MDGPDRPDRGDPALRHFEAKIRLLERSGGHWIDHGTVLPDEPQPYEREWAGSALLDGTDVYLFFTAAGVADRPGGYQQRLYEAKATLGADGFPADWSQPRPCLASDHPAYQLANAHEGRAGEIKAFRDPAFFRDPADGSDYLIFTASLADAKPQFNGAVGIAKRHAGGWDLLPPLLQADGVNNELERAHAVSVTEAITCSAPHSAPPSHRACGMPRTACTGWSRTACSGNIGP